MTPRSFPPWATPKHNRPDPGAQTRETIRANGHHDWDTTCDHWQNIAQLANETPNLNPGVGGEHGGTSSQADHNIVLQHQASTAWLNELQNLINQLLRSANRAQQIDQPPPKQNKTGNTGIEQCVLCTQDIGAGINGKPDCKRVDGHPLHTTTCYYQLYRQAQREHTTIGHLVEQLARTSATGPHQP